MKRILFILLCITCFSCTSNAKQPVHNQAGINVEALQSKIKEGDSILLTKFDSLKSNLDSLIQTNDELKKQLENKNNDMAGSSKIWLSILTIVCIALIVVFIISDKSKKKEIKKISRNLDDLKRATEFSLTSLKNKTSTPVKKGSSNAGDLEARITKIEIAMQAKNNHVDDKKEVNHKKEEKSKLPVEAYFGMVKGNGFFNDVYTVNKDECLFKITYLSQSEVSFVPLELKKIRFIDGIEKAVSYTGEKSLKEATAYEVKEAGYAVKQGDVWNIQDKVEIILK